MSNNNSDDYFNYLIDWDGDGRIDCDDIVQAQFIADISNDDEAASSAWKFIFGVFIAAILFFIIAGAIGSA